MCKSNVSSKIKWQVIVMFKCNKSQREIASVLNVSKTCVAQTIAKYWERHEMHDRLRSGRPKAMSLRDVVFLQDSPNRIGMHLCQDCIHTYMAVRKQLQSAVSRKNIWIWCRLKRNWGIERWEKVLFSDECYFELYSRRRICVRHTPTKKFLPECLYSAVQQGGGSIMVWD
ncbi:hypothetical protein PR048_026636 [Dryococelus australis]|uniref:Transposase n=1 Tax=Dryococelus australis TaxID=614101 RepID=A0ABQ9GLX9_9NEOP|nr:hypothetical protein PR048_026636 [Dryococelus australis]